MTNRWSTVVAGFVIPLLCLGSVRAATIETVHVGDPGNAADPRYGPYGAVNYVYSIGKFEVTNGQWLAFLNAVAKTADPYYLYTSVDNRGIDRSGSPGNYTYGPRNGDPAWLNYPAPAVSFWDACRFTNWLHNGQPTGEPTAATTEDGAYTLNGYNGTDGHTITRNPGARWVVPTMDEWYKAAFYKGRSTNAGYWRFPTQSDSPPTATAPPGTTEPPGSANCAYGGDYLYSYLTPVGAYVDSPGPYGTFDQGGNLWERTETSSGGPGAWGRLACNASYAGVNGWSAQASTYFPREPQYGFSDGGFRVVYLPEPATLGMLALGGLLIRRRRRA